MKITRRRFLGGLAALGAAGYGGHSNLVEVTEAQAPLPGLRGPLRVLYISDLHMPRCFVSDDTLRSAVEAFQPHVFCLVGDCIDREGNEDLVHRFRAIEAPLGKFAIFGNWEYWGDCNLERLQHAYAESGVRLLVNDTVELHDAQCGAFRLIGLDDLLNGDPQYGLAAADRRWPTVVLGHCPGQFDRLPPGPLVCLSGHTHGGQIAPLGITIYRPPGSGRYLAGLYSTGPARHLYVTRGLGYNAIPLRLGARPEIVRMTLVPA